MVNKYHTPNISSDAKEVIKGTTHMPSMRMQEPGGTKSKQRRNKRRKVLQNYGVTDKA